MTPLGANEIPGGSDPPVTDQVYPPAPPVAERVWEYGTPRVPAGSEPLTIESAGGLIVKVRALAADVAELSATWTVKAELPTAVGVPLIAPLAERLTPAGSEPLTMDHV